MGYRTNMSIRIIYGVGIPTVLIVLSFFHVMKITAAMGIIGVMFALHVFRHLNKKHDERTKRLETYARTWSWFFTYCFIMAWYFINHFKIVALSPEHLIVLFFFFMAYSYWITNFIVSARSDVPECDQG